MKYTRVEFNINNVFIKLNDSYGDKRVNGRNNYPLPRLAKQHR